jgi:tetratricopeptide (TPR) repeat protein
MLDTVQPMLQRDLPPGHYAFASLTLERALITSERGDQKSALELINHAITMAQNAIRSGGQGAFMFPAIYVMRAKIELRAGDATAAQADAEEAIKEASTSLQPGDTSAGLGNAYYFLAKALEARGTRAEALAAMRKSAEVFEKSVGPDCPYTQSARAEAADLASRSDPNAK